MEIGPGRKPLKSPDLAFGQIAIKVGLLTQEQVDELLAEQGELRKQRKFAPLGELCQMRGKLTSRQVQRVLLAQEFYQLRQTDELLAAILDMRGDVAEEELRMALDEQMEMYASEDRIPKPLGEILIEMGVLEAEKLLEVMTEHPEVRRGISDRKTDLVRVPEGAPPPPPTQGWLVLASGPCAGKVFRLGRKALIGRQPTNEVSIDDARASRQHAQVYFDPGTRAHVLIDLHSVNGTFVDDKKVDAQTPLTEGARIRVGDSTLRYTLLEPAPATPLPAPPPMRPTMGSQRKSATVHAAGPLELEGVPIARSTTPDPEVIPLAAVVRPSLIDGELPPGADLRTRLQHLVDLRLVGRLTEEEFLRRRKALLSEP